VKPPRAWCAGLQLFAVSDAETTEPLGLLYLDLVAREGKDDRCAQYRLIDGMLTPSKAYQHPTAALISSFPPASGNAPCLLSHQEVENLFHEFGLALHAILARAKFGRFTRTGAQKDSVEAPSQVVENWAWDRRVLDTFAADYRDPYKKIPRKALAALKDAKRATASIYCQHQLALAQLDLAVHTQVTADNHRNVIELSNQVLAEKFFPPAGATPAVSALGHLASDDAGYYGYLLADVIGADMTRVFRRSVGGSFDTRAGRRLRNEIYEPAGARDANHSIEGFLRRKQRVEPFWKTMGVPDTAR
jgi:thimet oligopeptidase